MKTIISFIILMGCLLGGTVLANESRMVLTKQELEELFTGKTAIGKHMQKNVDMKDYYSKKGRFVSLRSNGEQLEGKWWISKKRDAICIKYKNIPDKSYCRAVVKNEKGGFDKIRDKDGEVLVHYETMVKGNKTKADSK